MSGIAANPEANAKRETLRSRLGEWPQGSKRPLFTLVLAGLLALSVWGVSEWSYAVAGAALDNLAARAAARHSMQLVLKRLLDAETSQRGYLITARPEYLLPLDDVRRDISRELAALQQQYKTDPKAAALVDQLQARAVEKLSELSETLLIHDAGEHQRWRELVLTNIGREKMAEARVAVEQLSAMEDANVLSERADVYRTLELGRLGVLITTLLALVAAMLYLRQLASLHANERAHALSLQRERDELERQVRQRTLELSDLNRHLQDLRDAERSQLGRALHDNLGALLTAAKLDLTRLRRAIAKGRAAGDVEQRLGHLDKTIDDSIAYKREVIEELAPSALHNLGLRAALEILASDVQRKTGLMVTLEVPELELPSTPRIVSYRVVEAGLANVGRHAQVDSAQVRVRQQGEQVVVQVIDAGVGFAPEQRTHLGRGLVTLKYRIETLGGSLKLNSNPGKGAELTAVIPLAPKQWGRLEAAEPDSGISWPPRQLPDGAGQVAG